jgi:hypothetical protein
MDEKQSEPVVTAAPVVTMPVPASAPGMRAWDRRLQQAVIIIGRLVLAYLFFANLWWKLPPNFGCANNFTFPTANAQGHPDGSKSTGLCYWIGVESVYANQPRNLLVADMRYGGGQVLQVDISPLARLNGWFIDTVVKPNITWFGYLIVGAEAFIVITMFLGLFSRLGGLVAIGVSAQLMIGLANIPQPYEWEWSYNLMVMLSLLMFALAPGRYLGIDALLRPPLLRAAARGNVFARLVSALT